MTYFIPSSRVLAADPRLSPPRRKAASQVLAVSPRRLLEPRPDDPGELTEARRTYLKEVGHAVGVDAKIAVHEDVAEATEPLELLSKRGADHVVGAELGDDVFVVLGADAEVRAQDVVADVEDDLGAELEAALHGPHFAEALAQRAGVEPTQLLEARDDLLEPQEALADRFWSRTMLALGETLA